MLAHFSNVAISRFRLWQVERMKKQLTKRHPMHIEKRNKNIYQTYLSLTPHHQIGKLG